MADGKKITEIMRYLGCTREEAIDVIHSDELIDKGELLFELSDEQKQAAKKARALGVAEKRTKVNRERKVDNVKKEILNGCKKFLIDFGAEITSEKTETEIKFNLNGEDFTLKLTKHRAKKEG